MDLDSSNFFKFFFFFFFLLLFNNCENCELSALCDRRQTSPFNVDYPRRKKRYLSINFKKQLRKPKTANANEHTIPASSSFSSSFSSMPVFYIIRVLLSEKPSSGEYIYIYIYTRNCAISRIRKWMPIT